MKKCENCGKEHEGTFGSGRFCSRNCSNSRTFKLSDEAKEKISKSLKNRWKNEDFKHINWELSAAKGTKDKFKIPNNILNISSRTTTKILIRLIKEENFGCSRCGWNEGVGDIHHINGKKINNCDHHSNLTYVCPNCHRLIHQHKIDSNTLISLEKQIGDKWKKYYYG